MKAWIIRWFWVGDHAAVDQPIVAVLSVRTSAETVRKYVEFLYLRMHGMAAWRSTMG